MTWFYYVGRSLMKLLLWLLARWEVTGKENIPREGPLLVVANHVHLADPPLLGVSLNRKTVFMAKEELFEHPISSYFVRNFGAFPVRRGGLDRQALRQALEVLEAGMALIVFPEGMRSRSGQLRRAFHGAARIACLSGAPLLPVGIIGTNQIKGIAWLVRRPRLTVNIGRTFSLAPPGSKLSKAELADATTVIMRHIAELLPQEHRGVYKT